MGKNPRRGSWPCIFTPQCPKKERTYSCHRLGSECPAHPEWAICIACSSLTLIVDRGMKRVNEHKLRNLEARKSRFSPHFNKQVREEDWCKIWKPKKRGKLFLVGKWKNKRKGKPVAMILNFGCTLDSLRIYESLGGGQDPEPNKSESLGGEKKAVIFQAPQLVPGCRPMRPQYCLGRVYYRKTSNICQLLSHEDFEERWVGVIPQALAA